MQWAKPGVWTIAVLVETGGNLKVTLDCSLLQQCTDGDSVTVSGPEPLEQS